MPRSVVVVPCGGAKLNRPAPAGALYTGSLHRLARQAAQALVAAGVADGVLILSAKYGLLELADMVAPYDLRMTEPNSVPARVLVEQLRNLDVSRVLTLTPRAYTERLEQAARRVGVPVEAPLAALPKRGMGYQTQALARIRDTGTVAAPTPRPAPSRRAMTDRAPIPPTLDSLRVPVDGLVPYGRNPRKGNVSVIVDSLARHGQYRPIVVRAKTFEVLAGNHTLAAAKELGWDEIAATFVDVTDDEAARIVLVDNRAGDLGSYDDELLAELLAELPDLEGTGYDADDLGFLEAMGAPPVHDELGDLDGTLDDADRSMWPWVKVQLDPDNHREFQAVAGDTDLEKLLTLLARHQDA